MEFPLPAFLLEFLILGILEQKDSYGYEICQTIKQIQQIREPVLYPILKNLQQQDLIESYEEIHNGRRRKYYRLTLAGRKRLAHLRDDWSVYSAGISAVTKTAPASLNAHANSEFSAQSAVCQGKEDKD